MYVNFDRFILNSTIHRAMATPRAFAARLDGLEYSLLADEKALASYMDLMRLFHIADCFAVVIDSVIPRSMSKQRLISSGSVLDDPDVSVLASAQKESNPCEDPTHINNDVGSGGITVRRLCSTQRKIPASNA